MLAEKNTEPAPKNQTAMTLEGDHAIVIARMFTGPARIVFEAWTKPELGPGDRRVDRFCFEMG